MKITSDTFVSRDKDIPFSQLDEEYLAIDSQAGYVYSLNETANLVWGYIIEPISVDTICNRLQREFDIDLKTCRKDVIELLESLLDSKLIKVHNELLG